MRNCRRAASVFSVMEPLEDRQHLTTVPLGPTLIGEHFVGPMGAVTAVVLQFSEHLDPATATDPAAYKIGRHFPGNNDNSGSSLPGVFSLFAVHPTSSESASQKLHPDASVGNVTYDDTTMQVTLTADKPFQANVFFRFLRVNGAGAHAIRDVNGVRLNKGRNQVISFHFRRGKTLTYTDANHNRVQLKLQGPGNIASFVRSGANPQPLVYLDNTDPQTSFLTATIKKTSKKSTGLTTIQELSGFSVAQINLPTTITLQYTQ